MHETMYRMLLSDDLAGFRCHLDSVTGNVMHQMKQAIIEQNQHTCLPNEQINSGICTADHDGALFR